MEKRRINFAAMLTVTLFCFLQSANLFAQSTHFFISPDTSKVSLIHTVFYGSKSHSNTAPFSPDEANSPDVILSPVGRGNQVPVPWKYNIVATVFWVGEQATEGNPIPNTNQVALVMDNAGTWSVSANLSPPIWGGGLWSAAVYQGCLAVAVGMIATSTLSVFRLNQILPGTAFTLTPTGNSASE